MAQCKNIQMFPTCGSNGASYPEEFVNCADIRITDKAKIDSSTTNFPPWDWAVSKKQGWWGSLKPSVMNSGD
jgi:hypothetical protein